MHIMEKGWALNEKSLQAMVSRECRALWETENISCHCVTEIFCGALICFHNNLVATSCAQYPGIFFAFLSYNMQAQLMTKSKTSRTRRHVENGQKMIDAER